MTFHGAVESVPVRYHSRGAFSGVVVKSQWFVWEEGNLRQRKRCQKRDFSKTGKTGEKNRSRDGFSLIFHWSLEIFFHLFSRCPTVLFFWGLLSISFSHVGNFNGQQERVTWIESIFLWEYSHSAPKTMDIMDCFRTANRTVSRSELMRS